MEHFVAYHSEERMGYGYEPEADLNFRSMKVGLLKKALGNKVWVISGSLAGKRTTYFLCGAYIAKSIEPEASSSAVQIIHGDQETPFKPPVPLDGLEWFPAFLKSQANFSLGFNRIKDEHFIASLTALESAYGVVSSTFSISADKLDASAIEGTPRLVTHLRRERDSRLAEKKKAATLKATGCLACEVCGFDFVVMYGPRGENICEVHHKTPLSASMNGMETTLSDLAVLCSNCHRVIHHADPMLSTEELSKVVKTRPNRKQGEGL